MRCPHCQGKMPHAAACPHCGTAAEATLAVEAEARAPRPIAVKERPSETGVAAGPGRTAAGGDGAPAHASPPSTAVPTPADEARPRPAWVPSKERVGAWAVGRELSHYEVLGLGPETTDEEIRERALILEKRLDRWAGDPTDAGLQKLGSAGMNRLYELRRDLDDRPRYGRELADQSHRRALDAVYALVRGYVSRDSVLQWREWIAVEQAASGQGVGEHELEEILTQFRAQGVLTGLPLDGGREVRTLLALKDHCRGRGDGLARALWDGSLENWLRRAADKAELAGEVGRIKEGYAGAKASGACLFLWLIGEKKIVLGGVEIESVEEWIEACDKHGVRPASLDALRDRRLENWLRVAMNQPRLAEVAARQRGQGGDGLGEIISAYRGQGSRPFVFERGEAHTVGELVDFCDKYANEAQQYLLRGYFENWLANEQKKGPLALHAHNIKDSFQERPREGLEFFVRELCKSVGLQPFPIIRAHPTVLNFGPVPVGRPAEGTISLTNVGRGHAWGEVRVVPELLGLTVTQSFQSLYDPIVVHLDTLHVPPGQYAGEIHITAEGVAELCRIPIAYEVVPLSVSFDPPQLDFGVIPQGKQSVAALRVVCSPADGRLVGRVALTPACEGVKVSGRVDGAAAELRVDVDTATAEPGQRYTTNVHLETNAGRFDIPVRFSVGLRWDVVGAWTAGLGAAGAAVLGLCRYALGSADAGLTPWVVTYRNASGSTLLATGLLAAVMLLPLAIYVSLKIKKR